MPIQDSYKLPYSFAKRHGVFLDYCEKKEQWCLFHKSILSINLLNELIRSVPVDFVTERLSEDDFDQSLVRMYKRGSAENIELMESFVYGATELDSMAEAMSKNEDLLLSDDDAPIIKLINTVLGEAVGRQASDIHWECYEHEIIVRMRVDGMLQEVIRLPIVAAPMLVSRIKIMASLDIAEKRLPQDGRIMLRFGGHNLDVRVSTIPTGYGERVVMRVLDQNTVRLDLTTLGFDSEILDVFKKLLKRPHGIILVTGPTGSGKSTTLYAAINWLNQTTRNILTIEDPVEFELPGIGQMAVNNKVGMTFSRGLRAILRQDPDVVMVGEIRDLETAQIAIQASLTGHMVLSTLHTNTALGAIPRLSDMGIKPYLIASSLIAVLAQRLVRKVCPDCAERREATDTEMGYFKNESGSVFLHEGKGCAACHHTGYRGRLAIYELIPVDDELRKCIYQGNDEQKMAFIAHARYESLLVQGLRQVLAGKTTLDELIRVTQVE